MLESNMSTRGAGLASDAKPCGGPVCLVDLSSELRHLLSAYARALRGDLDADKPVAYEFGKRVELGLLGGLLGGLLDLVLVVLLQRHVRLHPRLVLKARVYHFAHAVDERVAAHVLAADVAKERVEVVGHLAAGRRGAQVHAAAAVRHHVARLDARRAAVVEAQVLPERVEVADEDHHAARERLDLPAPLEERRVHERLVVPGVESYDHLRRYQKHVSALASRGQDSQIGLAISKQPCLRGKIRKTAQ